MKNVVITLCAVLWLSACQSEQPTEQVSVENTNEISLVQESNKLRNEKGDEITVTYFAQGNDVAVKIQKAGEAEQVLVAKKVSAKGEPVFTNETMMWEGSIGTGGKLSDAAGNSSQYLEVTEK